MHLSLVNFRTILIPAIISIFTLPGCQPASSDFARYGGCEPSYQYDVTQSYASRSRRSAPYIWPIVRVVGPEIARILVREYGRQVAGYLVRMGGACLDAAIDEALASCSCRYSPTGQVYQTNRHVLIRRSYRFIARR